VVARALAQRLLKGGIERGFVSARSGVGDSFPQNIWAVNDGVAFEAQLENPTLGTYHGYPMPDADPLKREELSWWNAENV
jgi:hypothetical protein